MSKKKIFISLISAAVISLSAFSASFAAPEDNTQQTQETSASEDVSGENAATSSEDTSGGDEAQYSEDNGSSAASSGEYIENESLTVPDTSHAEAALLMDMNSGRLIYGKNIDERLYPASTTKMMTGILALESDKMNDTATATYEALKDITLEDSHMGILIGEELTMTDLLNGMLVYSANDAANVIAIQVAGSIDAFVDMMNAKAQELGMTNTHFVNACGVQNEDHYTTARDLATLARYCMQNETFRNIVKQPSYHIAPTNKYGLDRNLPSTNLFLSTSRSADHLYEPCTGIKTGTTEAAGHCLVASAEYNGISLLSVVLKCDDLDMRQNAYSYIITQGLFDMAFNNYQAGILASPGNIVYDSKVAEAKDDKRVTLTVDKEVSALIPIGDDISSEVQSSIELNSELKAPITRGQVLGTISYNYRGTEIGRATLVAANDVEQNMILHVFNIIIGIIINPLVFIPVILIIIIAFIARSRKRRRDRKRRIQQLKQRRRLEDEERFANTDRINSGHELSRSRSKGANSRYSDNKTRR